MTRPTAMPNDSKPALMPKLRFPEFRNGSNWSKRSLKELAEVITGQSPDGAYYNENRQGLPFYQGKTDFGEIFVDPPTKWTTQVTREADAGDILMSVRAPVGALNVATERICIGRGLAAIRARGSKWFLFYRLASIKDKIIGNGGSVFDSINKEQIEKLRLPVPNNSAEQQKIAECLSTLDELIGAESQKLDALKAHKKGLMQQLFPREGETRPRLRFPEFQNAPEWEEKTIRDACDLQAGKFVRATDIKQKLTDGLFPCYGGNGLRGYTSTYTHDGIYPLVGRQGALCGNVKFFSGRFHATEHALVATPSTGIDVTWLYYALDGLNLNRFATGQAQPGLSVDVLNKVPLAIPESKAEQHRIATCLSSLDELIAAQSDRLAALRTHKQGLLQQLFPSVDAPNTL